MNDLERVRIRRDNRHLTEALGRAIDRASGAIRPCPDCAGTGRDSHAFGYCPRCDGAGEIRIQGGTGPWPNA